MQHLSRVKDVFEYCYTSISNPDYCRLYYKQGCLRQSIQLMIKLYIEALVGLSTLSMAGKISSPGVEVRRADSHNKREPELLNSL